MASLRRLWAARIIAHSGPHLVEAARRELTIAPCLLDPSELRFHDLLQIQALAHQRNHEARRMAGRDEVPHVRRRQPPLIDLRGAKAQRPTLTRLASTAISLGSDGPRPLRLAAQDVALSRRKQGFDSPRGRQNYNALFLLSYFSIGGKIPPRISTNAHHDPLRCVTLISNELLLRPMNSARERGGIASCDASRGLALNSYSPSLAVGAFQAPYYLPNDLAPPSGPLPNR